MSFASVPKMAYMASTKETSQKKLKLMKDLKTKFKERRMEFICASVNGWGSTVLY